MATKVCDFCAIKYDSKLTQCPYCGSTDYKVAEGEYMNQLEDIRDDMQQLENVPIEEIKKSVLKVRRFVKIIVIVIIIKNLLFSGLAWWFERQEEKEFQEQIMWEQEKYPRLDEFQEAGE